MTKKRVFISFDYHNDPDLRDNLVGQADNPDSPFEIEDESLREPYESVWRQRVRGIIQRCDLVIVICGRHTDTAGGVAAEVSFAREVGTPYFLLRGRPDYICIKPGQALRDDEIHTWSWDNLTRLITETAKS